MKKINNEYLPKTKPDGTFYSSLSYNSEMPPPDSNIEIQEIISLYHNTKLFVLAFVLFIGLFIFLVGIISL